MLWIRTFAKRVFWTLATCGVLGIVSVMAAIFFVYWKVEFGDTSALQKSAIMARINEETTLYYLDEKTRIGSIFDSNHRRYVPIDEVPSHLINAVIAAEDKNFYNHIGIDLFAVGKAAWEGLIKGGRFRRGGSTITQQTVKNIVDDWEMSFTRKFREMIRALQLERLYGKKQIMEFYLNQFHVAGNGNGVGIAAKYYFNKDVKDLSLVEAAFVAGSVKGPGKYNPFIKYSKKTQARAITHANDRKNYVLSRMFEQGWIKESEYREALNADVPFKRGEFRTAEVSLVDIIRDQLKKKEVLEAIGLTGPEQLNVAGLRVFTTIDADFQRSAQLAMRRNLSRLETILEGFTPEPQEKYKPKRSLRINGFYYGKVEGIDGHNPDTYSIRISLGLPVGVIPNDSLVRYAKLLDLVDGKGYKVHLTEIVNKIKPGDVLFVQILGYDRAAHLATLEMHKSPKVGGGLIALDKGEVRAVVSGFDTAGYNRATFAKRQPGSALKSLIFFAGLQLGWSVLDRVPNIRMMFPYQGRFYYPRPDHVSQYENVSMLWTGVLSENIASVAIAATLLQKLNFEQFKKLMGIMGLLPKSGEAPTDYHYRVARETGISLDDEGVRAYQLVNAINDLTPDLVFSGDQAVLNRFKQMWWGQGYVGELGNIRRSNQVAMTIKELRTRQSLVNNNYLRFEALRKMLRDDWEVMQEMVRSKGAEKAVTDPLAQRLMTHFRVLPTGGRKPDLGYFAKVDAEANLPEVDSLPFPEMEGRPLNVVDVQAIWGHGGEFGSSAEVSLGDVRMSGYLPLELFDKLEKTIAQHYDAVQQANDKHMLYSYFQHHDFRIGLGLMYTVKMAKAAGVFSFIDPVLSMPLGSSPMTTAEVAKLYQTFIDGKTYRFFDDGPMNQVTFIRRIEDRSGKVLYEAKVKEYQLVSQKVTTQMREILRKVVTHGTGRRARGELYVALGDGDPQSDRMKVRVPAFGKTGTTNDYMTSYFAGFVPYPVEPKQPIDPANSYVIATYVGYDQNKAMHRGRQRIYGSSGALPLWTDFAKEIVRIRKYGDKLDTLDLSVLSAKEWPLVFDQQASPLLVDLPRGLILRMGGQGDMENWRTTDFATTGEDFQNQYELSSSVNSVIRIMADTKRGSSQPLRVFAPFNNAVLDEFISTSPGDAMDSGTLDIGATPGTTNTEALGNGRGGQDKGLEEEDIW